MNKEEIYDAEISPLMAEIFEVCQANNIAFLASFALPTEVAPGLVCTSALLADECDPPEELRQVMRVIISPVLAADLMTLVAKSQE